MTAKEDLISGLDKAITALTALHAVVKGEAWANKTAQRGIMTGISMSIAKLQNVRDITP